MRLSSLWLGHEPFLGMFTTLPELPLSSFSLCVCIEQVENHQMDFHEIWYWGILWQFVQPSQFLFRSDSFNNHSTWRPTCVTTYILPKICQQNIFWANIVEENETHFLFCTCFAPVLWYLRYLSTSDALCKFPNFCIQQYLGLSMLCYYSYIFPSVY
jgi:hypothetical protein